MGRTEKYVTKRELWESMDQDTRDFIAALTAPRTVTETVIQQIPDTPYTEEVEVEAEVRVTVKAIKLEMANKIWIEGHPRCKNSGEST